MMLGVKVVNETDQDIILYEGTGGVYRSLKTIPRGKKHVLKVDPNETYREYRCRLRDEISRKSEAVVFTPLVFAEYTHVTIKWDQTSDKLSYETKKKESGSNVAAGKPIVLVQRFLNKFSWTKEHATGDGGDGGGGGDDDVEGGGRDSGDGDVEGEGGGSGGHANVPGHGALHSQRPVLSSNV